MPLNLISHFYLHIQDFENLIFKKIPKTAENKKTEKIFSVLIALNILFVSLSQSVHRFYEIFILFNCFICQNKKQNS
jgi:hypothetical protein